MSIVYLIIFNDISIVGDRLFSVYSISLGVLLSYMFYCAKINNIKIFVTIFTVLIFLLLFFILVIPELTMFLPNLMSN